MEFFIFIAGRIEQIKSWSHIFGIRTLSHQFQGYTVIPLTIIELTTCFYESTNFLTNISQLKKINKFLISKNAFLFTVLSIWEIQNKYYIMFGKKIEDSYSEIRESMSWAWPLNSICASPISLLNTIYGTIFGARSGIWTELGVPRVTFIAVYVIINLKRKWSILKPILDQPCTVRGKKLS